jgi:Tfp pilus assembly protein PilF
MAMRLSSAALFVCLGACSTPQAPGGSAGSSAAPASAASVPASAEGRQAAPAPAEPVSAPVAAMTAQEVQRSMSSALDHLQAGQEDQAEAELTRILQSDPNNRLATSLLRQIKDDPVASLGRESFAYRVQPGESLSRIAQRFLNDLHLFYILARYNNIKVPRNLAGGQMIRVPGKAPAAASSSPTPAAAAPAAPSPPPFPPAATVTTPPSPAADTDAAAASRVARQRSEAVARHSRAARAAFAKQDLDAAIKSWDAVLEIDPDNRTAQLERQKVLGLKEKLGKVK